MKQTSPYIRNFVLQTLFIVFFASCLNTVNVLGSSDIFPTDYDQEIGIKEGTVVVFSSPQTRNYGERFICLTGIPYIVILILGLSVYIVLSLAHLNNKFCKLFRPFALYPVAFQIKYDVLTMVKKNKLYKPDTYKFNDHSKYKEVIEIINMKLQNETEMGYRRPTLDQVIYGARKVVPNEANMSERQLNPGSKCDENDGLGIYDQQEHIYDENEEGKQEEEESKDFKNNKELYMKDITPMTNKNDFKFERHAFNKVIENLK
jgi:hypothetical protein